MSNGTQIVFIIFTAIMLVSLLIELGAILAILLIARKMEKKVRELSAEVRTHLIPGMDASRAVVEDISPKVKAIASNLADVSSSVRDVADQVNRVVADVAVRTRAQAANVDEMIQGTIDQVNRAGNSLQRGISVPLRHLNGILNGVRAGIDILCDKTPGRSSQYSSTSSNAAYSSTPRTASDEGIR